MLLSNSGKILIEDKITSIFLKRVYFLWLEKELEIVKKKKKARIMDLNSPFLTDRQLGQVF